MLGRSLILCCIIACVLGSTYLLSRVDESCSDACYRNGMNCNQHIVTNNSAAIFKQLGVNCIADSRPWWAENQPGYVPVSTDPNYNRCLGWTNVPGGVQCGAAYPTIQRLCACDDPNTYSKVGPFGTGLSNSYVDTVERVLFNWIVPTGTYGVLTHFWATAFHPIMNDTVIRYYIDGEATASIEFVPAIACGVGGDDQTAPWGIKWFGKGAADGSWFNNFRIPFQKSVRVTYQKNEGVGNGFYTMIRGNPFPIGKSFINIGGIEVPSTAKMNLIKFDQVVKPLDWVVIADLPTQTGLFFMHTLVVQSGNLNFLEGCYHVYTPYNQSFPGTVVSTGTEDYFDSGWYFNAGEFRFPVSGFTHMDTSGGQVSFSAYRFHEMDPVAFQNGLRFVWRNGDAVDPAGQKCYMETGGNIVGSPTASYVVAYAWVYTW